MFNHPTQCQHFVSQLVEIYVNVNIRRLIISKSPLVTLWQTLWSTITYVQSQSTIFLEVLISPIVPKAVRRICVDRIRLWAVISCKLLNQSSNHVNQYLTCNHWKYCSVLRSSAFSEEDVENYWSTYVSQGSIKKFYTVFVRAVVLPRGYVGICIRRSHQKKTVPFSVSWGGKNLLSASSIKVEVIRGFGEINIPKKEGLPGLEKSDGRP